MGTTSKSKTRSSTKPPVAGKLAGKSVAFAGRFDYDGHFYTERVRAAGARVVKIESSVPDYVVVGHGRGGKPPAIVAQVQRQHPAVQVLDGAGLCRLLLPAPEEVLADLLAPAWDSKRWDTMTYLTGKCEPIDLRNADLRKLKIARTKMDIARINLYALNLDGADLRKGDLHGMGFNDLKGVKFDGANLKNARFQNAEDCSFRATDMREAYLASWYHKYTRCDFTQAKLNEARTDSCQFIQCNLADADLAEAEIIGTDFSGANLASASLRAVRGRACKFDGANLQGTVLFRADLRLASLKNADLRQADLRDAILAGADLTGAKVDGADFAGAALAGATLTGLHSSRARNFMPPVARRIGPKLHEFAMVAAASKKLITTATADIGADEPVVLTLTGGIAGVAANSNNHHYESIDAPTFEQGMFNLLDRWPWGRLQPDLITAGGARTLRGPQLQALAVAAWCEASGLEAPGGGDLAAGRDQARAAYLQLLRKGKKGIDQWNSAQLAKAGDFKNVDLSGLDLSGLAFEDQNFEAADFTGARLIDVCGNRGKLRNAQLARAKLRKAYLIGADCHAADFAGALLNEVNLARSDLSKACFSKAHLRDVSLARADLKGADFTEATITKVDWDEARFDEHTRFPAGFRVPKRMKWVGHGSRPGTRKPRQPAGPIDFDAFMQRLKGRIDAGKLNKALRMLKADRFQLFTELKPESLLGVVKSQTDKELVYACRLAADGSFGCGTQNLKPCGGLQGSLCKHLLVLIVGLAKSGQLDAAQASAWVDASRSQKPALDKDLMSQTFLRYKGAEAGEIDWRPTETIPEDYYAL